MLSMFIHLPVKLWTVETIVLITMLLVNIIGCLKVENASIPETLAIINGPTIPDQDVTEATTNWEIIWITTTQESLNPLTSILFHMLKPSLDNSLRQLLFEAAKEWSHDNASNNDKDS